MNSGGQITGRPLTQGVGASPVAKSLGLLNHTSGNGIILPETLNLGTPTVDGFQRAGSGRKIEYSPPANVAIPGKRFAKSLDLSGLVLPAWLIDAATRAGDLSQTGAATYLNAAGPTSGFADVGEGDQCSEVGYMHAVSAAGNANTGLAQAGNVVYGEALAIIAEAGFEKVKDNMVNISGGKFKMGNDEPDAFELEKPVHEVTVSPFQMGKTAVTNREYGPWSEELGERRSFLVRLDPTTGWPQVVAWGTKMDIEAYMNNQITAGEVEKLMGKKKAKMGDLQEFMRSLEIWEVRPHQPPQGFEGAFQPVIDVTWEESYLYAFMHGARLATEAEWEFAASEGGTKRFATPTGEFNASVVHSRVEESQSATADVNRKGVVAGPYGLFDMNGNVWEWVMDWDGDYSYTSSVNPTGPATGKARVARGGSWNDFSVRVLSRSFRYFYHFIPSSYYNFFGFRLVRPSFAEATEGKSQGSQ